jgi:hypothetical protein
LFVDTTSRSSIGVALAALLMLAIPAAVLAQEASESPASGEPAAQADGGIAFPTTLGGQVLDVEAFSGPEWLAQFSGDGAEDATFLEGTEGLVEGLDKTIDDLSVKTALYQPSEGNHAVVAAFRIDGSESRQFAQDAVRLMLGDVVAPELALRPVAGKWVLRVFDAAMPGVYPRTVYLKDDTAWIIEGDDVYVGDALDQLPASDAAGAVAAEPMISRLPLVLDGRRRTELYEATEPFDLPTLGGRLGPELESWLLDLYLGTGLTPSSMVGAITAWGVLFSQESLEIEGYQLPGAATEFVERLRREIILAETGEVGEDGQIPVSDLPEGVTRIDGEIAGRAVVTLDFGGAQQHVFSSGDTVWVVTDYVGETEMAAEAIAALP